MLYKAVQNQGSNKLSRILASVLAMMAGVTVASSALADPDCTGANHWPANMTFARLKNAGVLTNEGVDFSRTKSIQIASQKIGSDLYRQVFEVTFFLRNGDFVQAIAISDASGEECSMSDVKVYKVLGLGK